MTLEEGLTQLEKEFNPKGVSFSIEKTIVAEFKKKDRTTEMLFLKIESRPIKKQIEALEKEINFQMSV
jgi:hypothetical protein